MAFTVTARDLEHSGTSAVATETLGAFTPTADSLLVAVGHCELDERTQARDFDTTPITGGGYTYTERQAYEGTAAPRWGPGGSSAYRLNGGMWTAPVGGSPSSHTVVFDLTTGAAGAFYSCLAVDVTGHDVTTPHVQSAKNSTAENDGDNSVSLAVTMGSALTTDNLLIVSFGAGADSGGGFAAPTVGGQSMTQVYNRNGGYCQNGLWYRVITGDETNDTITCTDLGTAVGNGTVFAIEIAAESSGAEVDPVDIAHAHQLDSPAVTGDADAAPVDLAHASTLDSPAVSAVASVVPDDLSHGSTLDSPTVTAIATVTPDDLADGSTLDSPVVTADTAVTPDDLADSHQLDSPSVGADATVVPVDLAHAHVLDSPAVTIVAVVTPDDLAHGSTLDSPAVTGLTDVAPADLAHASTLDSPTLSADAAVAPADLAHGSTLDSPAVSSGVTVSPVDLAHNSTLDSPTVSAFADVAPVDLAHSSTLDSPALAATADVAPVDLSHAHELDSPSVTSGTLASPVDLSHASTLDSPAVTADTDVAPSDLADSHTLDSPTVTGLTRALTGYRAFDDVVTEGGSPLAAEDTTATATIGDIFFLRIQTSLTGDFPSEQFKIQVKDSADPDSEYQDVPA